MFRVISVYFNIRNTLPKSGTFLLEHSVYDKAVFERDEEWGVNFAVIEILSGNARAPRSAVYNTKDECIHAVTG